MTVFAPAQTISPVRHGSRPVSHLESRNSVVLQSLWEKPLFSQETSGTAPLVRVK